jgi:hypothetical protein
MAAWFALFFSLGLAEDNPHSILQPAIHIDTFLSEAELKEDAAFDRDNERIYTSGKPGKKSLAFCSCAKCGSTSAVGWLYENIQGIAYDKDPRRERGVCVQNRESWPTPTNGTLGSLSTAAQEGIIAITLVRDPIDRYVSAWKDKLRCNDYRSFIAINWTKGNVTNTHSKNPHPRGPSWGSELGRHRFAEILYTVSKIPGAGLELPPDLRDWTDGCLRFSDYAQGLRRIYAAGVDSGDAHWRTQVAPPCAGQTDELKLTAAQFEEQASNIARETGLPGLPSPLNVHASSESGSTDSPSFVLAGEPAVIDNAMAEEELCAIVRDEYEYIGDLKTFATRCREGEYKALDA